MSKYYLSLSSFFIKDSPDTFSGSDWDDSSVSFCGRSARPITETSGIQSTNSWIQNAENVFVKAQARNLSEIK